jgi:hypothetical protein
MEELTQINALEMMRTISELNGLVTGDLKMTEANTYTQYSGRSTKSAVPKFVLYTADAGNVALMLSAFDQSPLIVEPPPASAIFF